MCLLQLIMVLSDNPFAKLTFFLTNLNQLLNQMQLISATNSISLIELLRLYCRKLLSSAGNVIMKMSYVERVVDKWFDGRQKRLVVMDGLIHTAADVLIVELVQLLFGEIGGQTEGERRQVNGGLLLGVGVDHRSVAEVVGADVGRLVEEAGERQKHYRYLENDFAVVGRRLYRTVGTTALRMAVL